MLTPIRLDSLFGPSNSNSRKKLDENQSQERTKNLPLLKGSLKELP